MLHNLNVTQTYILQRVEILKFFSLLFQMHNVNLFFFLFFCLFVVWNANCRTKKKGNLLMQTL